LMGRAGLNGQPRLWKAQNGLIFDEITPPP
jgi:hypothetical protein